MTGTPSRTATASPRGEVGKKLYAKLRPEEHKPQEASDRWASELGISKPNVIRTDGRRCGGYMERRSRVLPREICSAARGRTRRRKVGMNLKTSRLTLGAHLGDESEAVCYARSTAS
jgi:hypothetical protein